MQTNLNTASQAVWNVVYCLLPVCHRPPYKLLSYHRRFYCLRIDLKNMFISSVLSCIRHRLAVNTRADALKNKKIVV